MISEETQILNTYDNFLFQFTEEILRKQYMLLEIYNCKYVKDFAKMPTPNNRFINGDWLPIIYNEQIIEFTHMFIQRETSKLIKDIDIELINKYVFIFINKLYKENIKQLLTYYKLLS